MPNFLTVFFKGLAMGAADVVPGVSGGTVAFITGIYDELLNAIKSINPKTLLLLFQQGPKVFWVAVNGNFLSALLSGIVVSFISLARIITWLMETQPLLLWSFFFGLVAASAIYIAKELNVRSIAHYFLVSLGFFIAFAVTSSVPMHIEATPIKVFLAGSIAICAMILPGISGSFILLLLGMYEAILTAVKDFDIQIILMFLAGCLSGLLTFVHILSWTFKRYRASTIALLTGFLLGSLNALWPWKNTLTYYTSSKGIEKPLQQVNVLPEQFLASNQQDPQLFLCIAMSIAGLSLVLMLERFSRVD